MKIDNLHRLLIACIFLILPGFITAQENVTDQASLESRESILENYQNQISNYDLIPFNKHRQRVDYIILDQKDNLISSGWKTDFMIGYFVEISDFLIEVDNTRYFRLSYENEVMLKQRIQIE